MRKLAWLSVLRFISALARAGTTSVVEPLRGMTVHSPWVRSLHWGCGAPKWVATLEQWPAG
jgi:hypothetical protein